MAQPTDPDILVAQKVREGDQDAWRSLYETHSDRLRALAYRLTLSATEAEDVVQDVFASLPTRLKRYDGRGSLGAWLRTVTARAALTVGRRENSRTSLLQAQRFDRSVTPPNLVDGLALEQALRDLSAELREVFILKEVEGYSHREIARIVGIRPGTSMSRLSRARQELQASLGGSHE